MVFSDGDFAYAQRTWDCTSKAEGRLKVEHLFEKLSQYNKKGIYPYHMPGHKRQGWGMLPEELYEIDITEIEDFDNLHQPEGILLELQREAARLYGAEESYYLVNGSTGGILSAVSAAVPFGGCILMARNCHKSAYHAAYLRHLQTEFLYPSILAEYGIVDAVTPLQVREALERTTETNAVLIVSPTYEGRVADIAEIAGVVHEKGIPLIVDEAHGAHLGLAEGSRRNSCQAGADLVIHSMHKTLPALTQTGLLHVNGERIDRSLLRRFLQIYQTSSPSYPLMASIDNALQYMDKVNNNAFAKFQHFYERMTEKLSECRSLKILIGKRERQDIGKLVISVRGTVLTGKALYDILLKQYGLQTEMASIDFVLAMFTINDGSEAYNRMTEALLEIDRKLSYAGTGEKPPEKTSLPEAWEIPQEKISLAEAWEMPAEEILLTESVGRYTSEFVNLYPPGIPLLIPGEQVRETHCREIWEAVSQGLNVQGIRTRRDESGALQEISIKILQENAEVCSKRNKEE